MRIRGPPQRAPYFSQLKSGSRRSAVVHSHISSKAHPVREPISGSIWSDHVVGEQKERKGRVKTQMTRKGRKGNKSKLQEKDKYRNKMTAHSSKVNFDCQMRNNVM